MVNFFNIDCMEFMKSKPDKCYDLAIVDPPYGININHNMGRRKGDKKSDYKKVDWDSEPPSQEYFNELFRVSKNQIIWGGNYFDLPPTKCFIIWRKPHISEKMSFAMCEYAWTNFDMSAKLWTGISSEKDRIHPTQKPITLYRWLLHNYAKPNDKILDTHGGSMSSAIACDIEGYSLDICEIDKNYFNVGVKRFENYKRQSVLFSPEQIKHIEKDEKQMNLFNFSPSKLR